MTNAEIGLDPSQTIEGIKKLIAEFEAAEAGGASFADEIKNAVASLKEYVANTEKAVAVTAEHTKTIEAHAAASTSATEAIKTEAEALQEIDAYLSTVSSNMATLAESQDSFSISTATFSNRAEKMRFASDQLGESVQNTGTNLEALGAIGAFVVGEFAFDSVAKITLVEQAIKKLSRNVTESFSSSARIIGGVSVALTYLGTVGAIAYATYRTLASASDTYTNAIAKNTDQLIKSNDFIEYGAGLLALMAERLGLAEAEVDGLAGAFQDLGDGRTAEGIAKLSQEAEDLTAQVQALKDSLKDARAVEAINVDVSGIDNVEEIERRLAESIGNVDAIAARQATNYEELEKKNADLKEAIKKSNVEVAALEKRRVELIAEQKAKVEELARAEAEAAEEKALADAEESARNRAEHQRELDAVEELRAAEREAAEERKKLRDKDLDETLQGIREKLDATKKAIDDTARAGQAAQASTRGGPDAQGQPNPAQGLGPFARGAIRDQQQGLFGLPFDNNGPINRGLVGGAVGGPGPAADAPADEGGGQGQAVDPIQGLVNNALAGVDRGDVIREGLKRRRASNEATILKLVKDALVKRLDTSKVRGAENILEKDTFTREDLKRVTDLIEKAEDRGEVGIGIGSDELRGGVADLDRQAKRKERDDQRKLKRDTREGNETDEVRDIQGELARKQLDREAKRAGLDQKNTDILQKSLDAVIEGIKKDDDLERRLEKFEKAFDQAAKERAKPRGERRAALRAARGN